MLQKTNLKLLVTCCVLAFSVMLSSGCGSSQPDAVVQQPTPTQDSHERMLEVLDEVRRSTPDRDAMFGDAKLRDAQRRYGQLGAGSPIVERLYLSLWMANREVELGRNEQAVDRFKAAYQLFHDHRDEVPVDLESSLLLDLAIANLRLGEVANCIHCQTSESCILPIGKGGVHTDQSGSRAAIEYLLKLLELHPDDAKARWLLNIAYMTIGGHPHDVPAQYVIALDRFASTTEFLRFANVAAGVGLNTVNLAGSIVADDFDNDGWIDVLTSNWHPVGQLLFFRNNGDGTFSDRTKQAGLNGIIGGLNLCQADYDNDGDLDAFVMRGAWRDQAGIPVNSLLQNDGKGHFRDVTFEAGLGDGFFPTPTAAWGDYDNDGDLDLFVGNEDHPCQLFENQSDGTFRNVAERAGVTNGRFTKGAVWGDFDGDNYSDLYVSNFDRDLYFAKESSYDQSVDNESRENGTLLSSERTANRLYRNNRDGTFTDVAVQLGVVKPKLSFAVWFWDYNNDGALDIFAGSWAGTVNDVAKEYLDLPTSAEPDCLYEGDGKGGFREVAVEKNITRVSLPMGANFGDLDNDGFPDFYMGTGSPGFAALMPNLMYHNRQGESFEDVTTASGFGHIQKGHGVAFADFDNDGDQDVFAQMGGAYPGDFAANALFENPGVGNHWITLRLVGVQSNRCAIGARVHAVVEEDRVERSIYKWVNSGGSFGANPLRQQIGVGTATQIKRLEIFWPKTGKTQVFQDLSVDQALEITESKNSPRKLELKPVKLRGQP